MSPQHSAIDVVADTLDRIDGLVRHHDPAPEPPRPGRYADADALDLHRAARAYLDKALPDGLFRHQRRALELVLRGRHTVVATRTSSGKSLIFNVPVMDALLRDPEATALFLYPQKALAGDQLVKLEHALRRVDGLADRVRASEYLVARYDGATPLEDRPLIREKAQVVLTNPDMLHLGILSWHARHWSRFFEQLRYVVVDECHEYRGIFGTNVAYVLRRLRLVCRAHGSSPCFVGTSATVRDPAAHLEGLTGLPFACVGPEEDGSRQGRKKSWMVSGEERDLELARALALDLAERGLSVLVFCPSRVAAELMTAELAEPGRPLPAHVRVYRAGLRADERARIEAGLRDGTVRVVFSTNALELGIDIGALDAVVCVGLPNSMMSLWQRAGRTARAGKEGAIVLVPSDLPIDAYYAEHPRELFERRNEPLALNLGNRRVVCQHYACAVAENGRDEAGLDADVLGAAAAQVKRLRARRMLDLDVFHLAVPHLRVKIRSTGEGAYALECGSRAVGEIDAVHLLRECPRHAIYRHGGRAYRVRAVSRARRTVELDRDRTGHRTTATIRKDVKVMRRGSVARYRRLRVETAALEVTERVALVVEEGPAGRIVARWGGSGGVGPHRLPTEGTRVVLEPPLWRELEVALGKAVAQAALQSVERLFQGLLPTVSGPCELRDYASWSHVADDGSAAVYLYDLVYDGIGLTAQMFDSVLPLVEKSAAHLEGCACATDAGCFKCIARPRADRTPSKRAARAMLDVLRRALAQEPASVTRGQLDALSLWDPRESTPCGLCGEPSGATERLCRSCGERLDGEPEDRELPQAMRACFAVPRLRATRIERERGRALGRFGLDAERAAVLGAERVGLFVSRTTPIEAAAHLRRLSRGPAHTAWVAVPWNKGFAAVLRECWDNPDGVLPSTLGLPGPSPDASSLWRAGQVLFATPERLREAAAQLRDAALTVAGVVLVDPTCAMQSARPGSLTRGRWAHHDRPRLVAGFRDRCAAGDWAPPFLLLTEKEPINVAVEPVLAAYGLEALIYLDGRDLAAAALES